MTAISSLLTECQRRGILLEVAGDQLRYKSPRGVLTPELVGELKAHKPELLLELSRLSEQQQAAIEKLKDTPSLKCAFVVGDSDSNPVRVSVAVRTEDGIAVGDLLVPAEKWDPFLFLEMIQRSPNAH